MPIKEKLLKRKQELQRYGSYLATEVFRNERKLLGRINRVLLYRYKII